MNEKNIMAHEQAPVHPAALPQHLQGQRRLLYMLLEFGARRKELFTVVHRRRARNAKFDGATSRASTARQRRHLVMGVGYLIARAKIVYRDLKPENIMIAADGYPKIVDFGFAKVIHDRSRTRSAARPSTSRPRSCSATATTKSTVDWWAVGAHLRDDRGLLAVRRPARPGPGRHLPEHRRRAAHVPEPVRPTGS